MFALVVFALLHCTNGDYDVITWKTKIYNPTWDVFTDKIPLLIHYPKTDDKTLKFPVIVFNHGGDCKNTYYDYVWQNLAPQGYIVAMPGLYEHPWISEYEYTAAQRYTLNWLRSDCNANTSCPLYGMVGNKSIASGHSMGGGASFLSVSNFNVNETFEYEFDASFTLSGCDNRYDELITSLHNVEKTKTMFIMSGSRDCICPPDRNSDVFYDAVPNDVCKILADITNGTHCHFEEGFVALDECELAEEVVFCPFKPDRWNLPPEQQYAFVNEYFTLFVNATMQPGANNQQIIQIMQDKLEDDMKNGRMANVSVASSCYT